MKTFNRLISRILISWILLFCCSNCNSDVSFDGGKEYKLSTGDSAKIEMETDSNSIEINAERTVGPVIKLGSENNE